MFEWLTPPGVPNSVPQMLLGYAFIFGVGIAYTVSLVVRRHSLQRDMTTLDQLEAE